MAHTTTVSVLTRMRPSSDFASSVFSVDERNHSVHASVGAKGRPGPKQLNFTTHGLLPPSATQADVFKAAGEDMVQLLLEGYNGTVFAYGQTGAGKTFTMTGGQKAGYADRGLVPRVIARTFELMDEERAGGHVGAGSGSRASGGGHPRRTLQASSLSVSYLEIYNETLFDLLSFDADAVAASRAGAGVEGNAKLAFGSVERGTAGGGGGGGGSHLIITEDREGGTHVRGLTRLPVTSSEEALSALFEGGLNRAVAEHALNAASTRSHCVFTLYLERQYAVRGKDGSVASTETVRSKLHLVDLAGSERQSKTGSEGGVQVQASYINKSLSFLEQVVLALLSRQREHVPYRSSKLTNMLKDSLGGNCRTRMIACVWPDAQHVEESVATLRFATRMMKVKTRVSKNVSREGGGSGAVSRATIAKYEGEIKALKRELAMHDALVGRTGVRYGPLTDAETDLIQDLVEAYVDAPSDDEGEEEGGGDPDGVGAVGAAGQVSARSEGAVPGELTYAADDGRLHDLAPASLHAARLMQVSTLRQVGAAFAALRHLARQARAEAARLRHSAGGGPTHAGTTDHLSGRDGDEEEGDGVGDGASQTTGGVASVVAPPPGTTEAAFAQWKAGPGSLTVASLEDARAELKAKKVAARREAKEVNAAKDRIDDLVLRLEALRGGETPPPAPLASTRAAASSRTDVSSGASARSAAGGGESGSPVPDAVDEQVGGVAGTEGGDATPPPPPSGTLHVSVRSCTVQPGEDAEEEGGKGGGGDGPTPPPPSLSLALEYGHQRQDLPSAPVQGGEAAWTQGATFSVSAVEAAAALEGGQEVLLEVTVSGPEGSGPADPPSPSSDATREGAASEASSGGAAEGGPIQLGTVRLPLSAVLEALEGGVHAPGEVRETLQVPSDTLDLTLQLTLEWSPDDGEGGVRGVSRGGSGHGSGEAGEAAVPESAQGGVARATTPEAAHAVRGEEASPDVGGQDAFTWSASDAQLKAMGLGQGSEPAERDAPEGGAPEDAFRHVAYAEGEAEQGDGASGRSGAEEVDRASTPPQAERSPAEAEIEATLADLRRAKAEYRKHFARVKELKAEVAFLTKQVAALKQRMLSEFDTWVMLQEEAAAASARGHEADTGDDGVDL